MTLMNGNKFIKIVYDKNKIDIYNINVKKNQKNKKIKKKKPEKQENKY